MKHCETLKFTGLMCLLSIVKLSQIDQFLQIKYANEQKINDKLLKFRLLSTKNVLNLA